MTKSFALLDCNNFFVSCERVFDPTLIGKPVVVLSSNDGCVIARSNEAKKLGVPMGAPAFQCKELFAQYGVIVRSSNFALYADMSSRAMNILAEYVADLEVYSIDEAFFHIPVTVPQAEYQTYAAMIRHELMRRIGLPVSIGMGPTKTLAKVANNIAKKQEKYAGVFDITQHPDIAEILQKLSVYDVWGIGRRYTKLLQRFGIETAYQLTQCSDAWIRQHMSIVGLKTVTELRGIPCGTIEMDEQDKKSITVSRSFGKVVTELQELKEAVAFYMTTAAAKLRAQNSIAQHITVFLCSTVYADPRKTYHTASCVINIPTAFTPELIAAAQLCLGKLFKKGLRYKKAGVILQDFCQDDTIQTTVAQPLPQIEKQSAAMNVIDGINSKLGKNTVFFAAAGTQQAWRAKHENKSPAYTTSWHELLTIKI